MYRYPMICRSKKETWLFSLTKARILVSDVTQHINIRLEEIQKLESQMDITYKKLCQWRLLFGPCHLQKLENNRSKFLSN